MKETENQPPPVPTNSVSTIEPDRPSLLRQILWPALVLLAFAAGLAASYLIWVRPLQDKLAFAENRAEVAEAQVSQQANAAADESAQDPAQNQEVQRYPVPIDDDPILGTESAVITIIEFSDYQCPFCKRWHQEVFPQIKEKYGDKVRFVFRDFPLYSIHPEAEPAAIAANCAGEQDRYYDYNDLLFNGGLELGRSAYEQYASQLGLKLDAFKLCLNEERYKQEVTADYEYASNLGVRSTPTFFINGLAIVGAQPFEVFEQVIDMELAGEIP